MSITFNLLKRGSADASGGDSDSRLFIDYKGKLIRSIVINGQSLGPNTKNLWNSHRIHLPDACLTLGENTCVIEFESLYVTDCQGFQYFKDEGDGTEYAYTELEPDYCHIVFPCFDQPDLKATYRTCILAPEDWDVITNSKRIAVTEPCFAIAPIE